MGQLVHAADSNGGDQMFLSEMSDLLYCRLCFEEQLSDPGGSLSKVYCTAITTSSGNHLAHAASKHGVRFERDLAVKVKLEDHDLFESCTAAADISGLAGSAAALAMPELDFKRDFVMLACLDLRPMSVVDQPGFRTFCEKHTALELPSRFELSTAALSDEFDALRTRIVEVLGSCVGGTLMLDSWSDGTTGPLGRRFLAIRMSFVQNWSFEVLTLTVRPVDSLTASTTAPLVRDVIAQFLPQNGRRCVLFNSSADTAEMRALSSALAHERISCVADSMNRLLTVDSLCRVDAVVQLLTKCRALVVAVHFHGFGVDAQRELDVQRQEFDMLEEMAEVHELLRLDDLNPLTTLDVDRRVNHDDTSSERPNIPTRWTIILASINAVLNNRRAVGEGLRRAGRVDLCPDSDDVELLTQLRDFLTPFQQFAVLAAECSPNLSLIPLIRTRIERQCAGSDDAGCCAARRPMDEVRRLVTTSLDARLPLTDLVRLNICFDPAVRDVMLSSSECEELLTTAYRRLRDTPLTEHFPRSTSSVSCPTSDDRLQEDGGSTAAKRLRLSLLMESSSSAGLKTSDDGAASEREALDEIRRYLTLHDDAPALEFWKRHADSLPILAVIAGVYLAVCPGSVPFDRLFSTRGLVVNDRLASLPPYRVNMMATVHENCHSSLLQSDD